MENKVGANNPPSGGSNVTRISSVPQVRVVVNINVGWNPAESLADLQQRIDAAFEATKRNIEKFYEASRGNDGV